MAQLASDLNNPQFAGAMDPDSVMIAKFYKKAVHQPFESEKEGRPIYKDVVFIQYYPAGNTLMQMDVPAQEHHKQRFAKQWAYYERTQKEDGGENGTPLSQWAVLSPADVENLRGMKIQTVENIANMSDGQLQVMGMGIANMAPYVLRAKAQAYLGSAQDSSLPQKQAAEMEAMKKELAEMRSLLAAKPEAPKKRKEWTEEMKQAARERMAKARAAKKG